MEAWILRLLGEIHARRDASEIDQLEDHYRRLAASGNELKMRPLIAHCHLGLGDLYTQLNQSDKAQTELSAAVDLSFHGDDVRSAPGGDRASQIHEQPVNLKPAGSRNISGVRFRGSRVVHFSDSLSVSGRSAPANPFVSFKVTQTEQSLADRFDNRLT